MKKEKIQIFITQKASSFLIYVHHQPLPAMPNTTKHFGLYHYLNVVSLILSLVAFSSSTESIFTQLRMNHMLLAIYLPCLKFFCFYRHPVKFSGQIKCVRKKHKSISQTGNGTISLIKKHLQ